MAHQLDMTTGNPAMAYVGEDPWHGLGEKLEPGAPIEAWIKAARLEWQILQGPACFQYKGKIGHVPGRQVLFRSDTGEPLSIVSDSYCIVQPKEVIEFYRDLVSDSAFSLETAGALDGGRKVWGLARSGFSDEVAPNDRVDAFLLLASSCDKSLATTVAFTSIRVVCQNTLSFAMEEVAGKPAAKSLKISHDKRVDWIQAKKKLGLIDGAWSAFVKKMKTLAEVKVDQAKADDYFEALFRGKDSEDPLSFRAKLEVQRLKSAFVSGRGQDLESTKGTAWGLVNAVSFYVDHQSGNKSQSERLDSAWFGSGATLKAKAWDTAIEMFQRAA